MVSADLEESEKRMTLEDGNIKTRLTELCEDKMV